MTGAFLLPSQLATTSLIRTTFLLIQGMPVLKPLLLPTPTWQKKAKGQVPKVGVSETPVKPVGLVSNFRWIMNIALHYNYVKRYQHDDSETLEDIVIFSATDGFNTADGVLRVQIPEDLNFMLKTNPELQPARKCSSLSWLKKINAGIDRRLMLLYMHNDTESLEDSFTVQLTDGKRTVQGTLYIYIMPVNDEIPHLSRSMDLETEAAEESHSSAGSEADTKDAPGDELK
ncbi:hypothetical protein WISP_04839 [Willisornis vidua]|uniref:Uncharacterized protein n=1 Tax=Willisornis vidua TaxID=1566151 RepID=A0ABQ9DT73_9PASS|nr:hypothetical protein WISP_04839 [Willisornis vidua]